MIVIENDKIIPFDCDETLLLSPNADAQKNIEIICPYDGEILQREPHLNHIKLLKTKKARGYYVIVWTANGFEWGKAVINRLGLEKYVDCVMTKPHTYVDDTSVEKWMPYRIYMNQNESSEKV
jgi:FMN phosphatase YigB (HAD superfamily)